MTTAVQQEDKIEDKDKKTVTVTVFAPRTPEPKTFTWPRTMTIGDAAGEAARAFGYQATTPTLQNEDEEVLDRQQTLHQAKVKDGDKLEIVDTGGGVVRCSRAK